MSGGSIAISGTMTGDIDEATGDGALTVDIAERVTDWTCVSGYTINGSPSITAKGTVLCGQPVDAGY